MQNQVPYSEAINTKYPEQIVIAIAKDAQGKYNPITLGWTMICSDKPPMLAISVSYGRHSLEAIQQAGEFVIAFPSDRQADEAMLFGTKSGRDTDKLAEAGTPTQPAERIDCVLLAEAVANFECKLVGQIAPGDHVIFVGEVLCAHKSDTPLSRLYSVAPGHKLEGLARQT